MSQMRDFRAGILRTQIMELQRFLKALEHNHGFQKDGELGIEALSNIELQLKTISSLISTIILLIMKLKHTKLSTY